MNKFVKLLISLFIPLSLGGIAGYVTSQNIPTWYAGLNKPFFNPPNWLFAPVWTTMYILLGISLYLVWTHSEGTIRKKAFQLWGLQMLLNFTWSFLFFYFHNPLLAFINIAAMWVAIFLMIRHFTRIYKPAGWMNIPYLLWVSFASLLNISIWWLN